MADFDLTIIGGGPGGYVAAIRAAQLKAKVALVEEKEIGGTCLNVGCIPTKTLNRTAEVYAIIKRAAEFGVDVSAPHCNFPAALKRKDNVVRQLRQGIQQILKSYGITVINSRASIARPGEIRLASGAVFTTDKTIIATGSRPVTPPIPGADLPGVMDSTAALSIDTIPPRLLIIGGGVVGMEFACIFHALGSRVTVIETLSTILGPMDEEISRRLALQLKKEGMDIRTQTRVSAIHAENSALQISVEGAGGVEKIEAERVLLSVGRVPNLEGLSLDSLGIQYTRLGITVNERLETSVPGIYAIGDCIGGPMLAHKASAEGLVAAENACGRSSVIDRTVIPSCVFTFPEVSGVGLTEKAAKEQKLSVKTGKFSFAANGKALGLGEMNGLVKIVAEESTNKVVGVHIMGPHASDLIAEGTLAVRLGLTAEDLADTIHAHPTLSETLQEAAHSILGSPIHSVRGLAR